MITVPKIATALILIAVLPAVFAAQAKRSNKPKAKAKPTVTAAPKPTPDAPLKTAVPPKRNERPDDGSAANTPTTKAPAYIPVYFYEFTRPGFTYSPIRIEHDEAGKGQISFQKDGSDQAITDPIELSPVTLAKVNDAFAALNFLDSTETYQTSRDYSNMGNVVITVKKGERQRVAKYNWTENKNARVLSDEYRRIGNQYIWKFEITLARDNQPLQAPSLMDQMDDYLKRQEISDPPQMLPLLRELSNDERIPLIARNHAAKLVAAIEKQKK